MCPCICFSPWRVRSCLRRHSLRPHSEVHGSGGARGGPRPLLISGVRSVRAWLQVLSPLHTMLAHVSPASSPDPASALPPEQQERPLPASGRSVLPAARHHRDAPVPPIDSHAPRTQGPAAAADADRILALAGVEEGGGESALRGGSAEAPSVVAPCITAMRARGLRQQRVSRESRRESTVLNLDLAAGGLGSAGASADFEQRSESGGRLSVLVSHRAGSAAVAGGPLGGAGAVFFRERLRSRQPRASGEVGLNCEVVFGEELGRVA